MNPLAVIPCYVTDERTAEMTSETVRSLIETTQGACDVLVVDDMSPRADLVDRLQEWGERYGVEFARKTSNSGFAETVNVGLEMALDEGRDAVLVNADIVFFEHGWLENMQRIDAYVVGAQLIYPSGLIQHAGVMYSVLHRHFEHIYRFAPANMPEAQVPRRCPVTAALQYIRHECLALVGTYDEGFRMGWEDLDLCIRVFEAGRDCMYEPTARAIHHESVFRGRKSSKLEAWTDESWRYLHDKHAGTDFSSYCPTMLLEGEGWAGRS